MRFVLSTLVSLPILGFLATPSRADGYAVMAWPAPVAQPLVYAAPPVVYSAPAATFYSVPVMVATPVGLPTYQYYGYPEMSPRLRKVEYRWKDGMWEMKQKWR
ncbi:MAG: hypothetical protein IT428_16780 [Planctomycetaceae bacterium]|nr:hypothetical protein [Planctomycetaceae bacterium]